MRPTTAAVARANGAAAARGVRWPARAALSALASGLRPPRAPPTAALRMASLSSSSSAPPATMDLRTAAPSASPPHAAPPVEAFAQRPTTALLSDMRAEPAPPASPFGAPPPAPSDASQARKLQPRAEYPLLEFEATLDTRSQLERLTSLQAATGDAEEGREVRPYAPSDAMGVYVGFFRQLGDLLREVAAQPRDGELDSGPALRAVLRRVSPEMLAMGILEEVEIAFAADPDYEVPVTVMAQKLAAMCEVLVETVRRKPDWDVFPKAVTEPPAPRSRDEHFDRLLFPSLDNEDYTLLVGAQVVPRNAVSAAASRETLDPAAPAYIREYAEKRELGAVSLGVTLLGLLNRLTYLAGKERLEPFVVQSNVAADVAALDRGAEEDGDGLSPRPSHHQHHPYHHQPHPSSLRFGMKDAFKSIYTSSFARDLEARDDSKFMASENLKWKERCGKPASAADAHLRMVRSTEPAQLRALRRVPGAEARLAEQLDLLGHVEWSVNDKVWETVYHVFRDQERHARDSESPPPRFGNVPNEPATALRQRVTELKESAKHLKASYWSTAGVDAGTVTEHLRQQRMEIERKAVLAASSFSKRNLAERTFFRARRMLESANPTFRMTSFVDFRGRAYPLPTALTPTGDDFARALLVFGNAKPLGEKGLRWLKIHLANLVGYSKVSFDDRVKWTDAHLDVITSDDVWTVLRWCNENASSPAQAFATCCEIANAVHSPDGPHAYLSRLPVHQDGSCNGLQHYAALGRDEDGGSKVNLVDQEKPADVYTDVANLVKRKLQERVNRFPALAEAAKMGEEDFFKLVLEGMFPGSTSAEALLRVVDADQLNEARRCALAKAALPLVSRKVVKQTIMTSVYGVTLRGSRDQILRQLEELGEKGETEEARRMLDKALAMQVAGLLAKDTIDAIGDTFQCATQIMEWLQKVAKHVAKTNNNVAWLAPLGLPVVEPYSESQERMLLLSTPGAEGLRSVAVAAPSRNRAPKTVKQSTAYPPNYVHSLDSAHMFMTAARCREDGLVFAAVHDSFWTHAGDVDQLSKTLREQFVALHSRDLVEELRQQLLAVNPTLRDVELFKKVPAKGTLRLEEVLKSTYFFN